jgi:hypothetical protein
MRGGYGFRPKDMLLLPEVSTSPRIPTVQDSPRWVQESMQTLLQQESKREIQ